VQTSVVSAQRYVSTVYAVVVCPSVTSWHCTKTAKHSITQTSFVIAHGL